MQEDVALESQSTWTMVAQGSNTGGGTYTSFSVSWGVLLYSGFFWIFLFEISSMSHHGNHGRSSATWGNHLFCAEFHPESTHVFSFAQILLIPPPRAFYPFFRVLCLPGREQKPAGFWAQELRPHSGRASPLFLHVLLRFGLRRILGGECDL